MLELFTLPPHTAILEEPLMRQIVHLFLHVTACGLTRGTLRWCFWLASFVLLLAILLVRLTVREQLVLLVLA